MDEKLIREIVREELSNERVDAAGATPIGTVTKDFYELMKRHKLTYREATLIFRDARRLAWPTLNDRG